ncbi:Clp protease N-terminal domain-containing protein [Modestobacter altitudinis]|uniref:Clp protease N-terminal domain-containing protein n=1 Tax=Modestobacter altitudinis TaxID=2213158 RepID=UPI00110CCF04|nr:Clp protease N-terminal domain-containing protein [Modestobacter altitudinis]
MLLYDDRAAEALNAAADEARRLGATRYETAHVLLGLVRTADPVTRTLTADHPRLTVDAARTALGAPSMHAPEADGGTAQDGRSRPEPAAEFRRASGQFTAKWRPLVRDRQLRPGSKLGTGELWLTVLEPATTAARVLAALGVEPDDFRPLVLATMVPAGAPVPDWPTEVPAGAFRRLLDGVLGSGGRS